MSNEALHWYQQLTDDEQSQIEAAKIDFAVDLAHQMGREGLKKRDLATKLGTSAAYATKVLRGDANLTIDSMVRLARAAGGTLHIHIAPQEAKVRWFDILGNKNTTPEPITLAWVTTARNPDRGQLLAA